MRAGTQDADQKVTQEVTAAATAMQQDLTAQLIDIKTKLDASATQTKNNNDAALARLIVQVAASRAAGIQAAEGKQFTDTWLPATDATFNVNPSVPESALQKVYDYLPSVKTVAFTAAAIGAGILIPGAGTILFTMAAGSLVGGSITRYYDGGHTVAGAILGSGADMTGVTAVYAAITDRDIASGNHLNLTAAQSREMLTEGTFNVAMSAVGAGTIARGFVKGRSPVAPKPAAEQAPPPVGTKAPPPVEAAPPPCPTANSGAGKAGTAEGAAAKGDGTCFVAGTKLRTPNGWKEIENFLADDEVISRPEYRPEDPNTVRKVVRLLTRSGKLLELWVDGRKIEATPEHPFWVVGQGWIPAVFLVPGAVLLTSDNRQVRLDRIEDRNLHATVYNIEIEADHTYFVGGDAWGFDVWSHNHNEGAAGAAGEAAAPNSLIGVTQKDAASLGNAIKKISIDGTPAIESVEAFGSRAGSTFRGPPTPKSDLDIYVTVKSDVANSPVKFAEVRNAVNEIADLFTLSKKIEVNAVIEIDAVALANKAQLKNTPFVRLDQP